MEGRNKRRKEKHEMEGMIKEIDRWKERKKERNGWKEEGENWREV